MSAHKVGVWGEIDLNSPWFCSVRKGVLDPTESSAFIFRHKMSQSYA